jgi:hypothetical protein
MKNLIMFEKFNEGENPWDSLVAGDVYNIYDMDNNGNILHSFGEFVGEKNGKLEFKSLYQKAAPPYLIDKDKKYSFIKKQRPKGK